MTSANGGGASCARYGAPFDARFAPMGSWECAAASGASRVSWGGRSSSETSSGRRPELGRWWFCYYSELAGKWTH